MNPLTKNLNENKRNLKNKSEIINNNFKLNNNTLKLPKIFNYKNIINDSFSDMSINRQNI